MAIGTFTSRFGTLTPAVLDRLRTIAGAANVLTDRDALTLFASDETEDLSFLPQAIVKPATTAQVSAVLELANREHIPVTPRGGGTGLSGGALAVHGGICLAMEKFNNILEIDRDNFQAVVEPGVITQKFQEALEPFGLFYPPDPASRGSCQLGGNLAECAGGPRAVKYGVTRDYVIGLEAVLPTGAIITTGGRVLKSATGYNLTHLLIGSEGTLAVITKIIFRLIPLPKSRKVLLAAFSSLEDPAACVASIFREGVVPSALEFMERAAVQAAEERLGKNFPNGNAAAQLLIEVDGSDDNQLARDLVTIGEVVERHHAVDVLIAEERQKVEDVWALRRSIGEAVKGISAYKEEDTVVPRARLPHLIRGVKEICMKHGITSVCYGHAGDGNVHVNLLKEGLDQTAWEERSERAITEIFRLAVSLGGTISGEHGIGYTQKSYLSIALAPAEISLMKAIKHSFDPNGILNPAKIFPDA